MAARGDRGVRRCVWLGFPVQRLGRSRTTDYTIAGGHMAERCQLFVILALGESILRIGANFGDLSDSAATIAAFVAAFIGERRVVVDLLRPQRRGRTTRYLGSEGPGQARGPGLHLFSRADSRRHHRDRRSRPAHDRQPKHLGFHSDSRTNARRLHALSRRQRAFQPCPLGRSTALAAARASQPQRDGRACPHLLGTGSAHRRDLRARRSRAVGHPPQNVQTPPHPRQRGCPGSTGPDKPSLPASIAKRASRRTPTTYPVRTTSTSDSVGFAGGSFAIWMQERCRGQVAAPGQEAQTCFRAARYLIAASSEVRELRRKQRRGFPVGRGRDRGASSASWRWRRAGRRRSQIRGRGAPPHRFASSASMAM